MASDAETRQAACCRAGLILRWDGKPGTFSYSVSHQCTIATGRSVPGARVPKHAVGLRDAFLDHVLSEMRCEWELLKYTWGRECVGPLRHERVLSLDCGFFFSL